MNSVPSRDLSGGNPGNHDPPGVDPPGDLDLLGLPGRLALGRCEERETSQREKRRGGAGKHNGPSHGSLLMSSAFILVDENGAVKPRAPAAAGPAGPAVFCQRRHAPAIMPCNLRARGRPAGAIRGRGGSGMSGPHRSDGLLRQIARAAPATSFSPRISLFRPVLSPPLSPGPVSQLFPLHPQRLPVLGTQGLHRAAARQALLGRPRQHRLLHPGDRAAVAVQGPDHLRAALSLFHQGADALQGPLLPAPRRQRGHHLARLAVDLRPPVRPAERPPAHGRARAAGVARQ